MSLGKAGFISKSLRKEFVGKRTQQSFFPSHFVQALDTDGALIMPTPWANPNLLVWWLYASTAAFSLSFYFLGAKKFRAIHAHSL